MRARAVSLSWCFRSARWLDGHLSISKSCRQSTTSYINTCEYMGCRPNVRAREERATPQFTCYPTSNATVPLGSGCDAIPPRVRRNVLKRKASSVGLWAVLSAVCVCFENPDSGARIWQSQQVMTEALVRSHPEPQRTLPFLRRGRPLRPSQALLQDA